MKSDPLPPDFVTYLRRFAVSDKFTNPRRLYRMLILRWILWSDGIQENAIPGYATPPPPTKSGNPAGWTLRNFSDIAREAIGSNTIRKARRLTQPA
jgi:hypothetical protein